MTHRDLYEEKPNTQPTYRYAGFGERLVAILIDRFIFAMIVLVVFRGYDFEFSEILWKGLISIFLVICYHVYFETSSYQATIGKKVMNLKVIKTDGQPLTIADSVFRYFGSLLSVLSFNIGHLMVIVDTKNRALHDYIAGTYVIKSFSK